MTINRDTVAAAVGIAAQAGVAICGKHGWLSSSDVDVLAGSIAAVWGTFHIPNQRAADALAAVSPRAPAADVSDAQAEAVATAAADPPGA